MVRAARSRSNPRGVMRRRNPVGEASYLPLLGEIEVKKLTHYQDKAGAWRAQRFFPSEFASVQVGRDPETHRPIMQKTDQPGKAVLPASLGYAEAFQPFSWRFSRGAPPVKTPGALSKTLDGLSEADIAAMREWERPQHRSFSGGYAYLNNLGTEGMKGSDNAPFLFGTLVPYSDTNPNGTGIYRAFEAQLNSGTVRGDEAYAALRLLKTIGSVITDKTTNSGEFAATTITDVRDMLSILLGNIFLVLFGDNSAALINEQHLEGIRLHGADKSQREERKAARKIPAMGAETADDIRAAQRAKIAEMQARRAGATRAPPEFVPAPTTTQVQDAAAAITAPVTLAAPAAVVVDDAIQSLLDLGISLKDAQWVMSLPRGQRIGAMRVAMGN